MGEDSRVPPLSRRVPGATAHSRPAGRVTPPKLPESLLRSVRAALEAEPKPPAEPRERSQATGHSRAREHGRAREHAEQENTVAASRPSPTPSEESVSLPRRSPGTTYGPKPPTRVARPVLPASLLGRPSEQAAPPPKPEDSTQPIPAVTEAVISYLASPVAAEPTAPPQETTPPGDPAPPDQATPTDQGPRTPAAGVTRIAGGSENAGTSDTRDTTTGSGNKKRATTARPQWAPGTGAARKAWSARLSRRDAPSTASTSAKGPPAATASANGSSDRCPGHGPRCRPARKARHCSRGQRKVARYPYRSYRARSGGFKTSQRDAKCDPGGATGWSDWWPRQQFSWPPDPWHLSGCPLKTDTTRPRSALPSFAPRPRLGTSRRPG